MAFKATIRAAIELLATGPADLGEQEFRIAAGLPTSLPNGSGSGQANKVFADKRTLAASATENLDLAGSLTDPFGQTLTFTAIKAIFIKAAAGNTNNVVVGGAGSNTFIGPFNDATDKIVVKPGAVALITAPATGWTVTAGTGDILLVANSSSGTSVDYEIVIVGV